jgi:hypothetical protein
VHAAFNLLFVDFLFTLLQFFLFLEKFLFSFEARPFKRIYSFGGKPTPHTTLYVQSSLLSLLFPHSTAEVSLRVYNLVVSAVNVKASLFHLTTLFSHHVS